MLHVSTGIDWQKSPAHLLLLSKFLQPRTLEDFFARADSWKDVLGETPQQAIKRFLDDRALVRADLNEHLAYRFKANELKEMLKQRGLSVSGRKEEMIVHLIQADPNEMKRAVEGLIVIHCSEHGSAIAHSYLDGEKGQRIEVEEQVMDAIRRHAFKEASSLVASYEAKQVFPRGINIDWKNHNNSRDLAILSNLFRSVPKQLMNLSPQFLEQFRIAACMMHLWGTNRGKEWVMSTDATGLRFDNDSIIRMLISHALYLNEITNYKRIGVKKIRILTCNDHFVCVACQELTSKTHKLSEVPEIPYEKCTCEYGCRCWIAPGEF